MASKNFFATLLICFLLFPGILLAEESEDSRDDTLMTVQSGGPVRYSTLNNAELFTAEREMRELIGKDPGNARYYFALSDICTVLFDRTRKQKGIQADEWLFKSADALEKVVMIDPANRTAPVSNSAAIPAYRSCEQDRPLQSRRGLQKTGQDGTGARRAQKNDPAVRFETGWLYSFRVLDGGRFDLRGAGVSG